MADYTSPIGNDVDGNFITSYTPSIGNDVDGNFTDETNLFTQYAFFLVLG